MPAYAEALRRCGAAGEGGSVYGWVLNLRGARGYRDPNGTDRLHGDGRAGSDGAGNQAGADHRLGGQAEVRRQGLGGWLRSFTDSQICKALRLIEAAEPAS